MCRVEDHQHDKSCSSSSTICSTTSRPPLATPLVSPLPNTSSTSGSSYNDEISSFVHNGDNESTASAKREEYHTKNQQHASSILVTSTGGTVSHRRADAHNVEHKSVFIIKEGEHSSSYSNRSNRQVGPCYSLQQEDDEGAGRDECYKNNVNEQNASFDNLNQRIVLLGLDISRFQDNVQFCICAGGVFVFTIAYGYLQELVSVHLFSRQYTLFLSTCQFAGYAFWSWVLIKFDKYSQRISSGCSKSRGKEHPNGSSWKDCFRNRFAQRGRYEVVERQHLSASGSLSIASTGSMTSCSSSFGKSTVHDVDVDGEEEENFHDKEKGLLSTNRQQSEMSSNAGGPSWILYITLSIIRAIDVGMTNGAMRFINYPMKTLVKSSRVAFTMMCGIVIGKKRYTREQYIMVFMLVFGLCIFIHADMSTKDAVFHPIGLSMLAISLLCDGALANYSEQIMIKHNITQDEFQFSIYSISFLGMLLVTIWSDEFMVGFSNIFLRNGTISEIQTSSLHQEMNDRDGGVFFWNAGRKATVMILFTLTGLCGSSCNGAITKKFGALSMSITSTSRKACTLFISFMSFPSNKCTTEHLTGMTIFISALIMKSSYPSGRTR